jgi:murein L,D-transpeptidase YafK
VGIPVIASGGAGTPKHLLDVLTAGKADAALIASMVHYRTYTIDARNRDSGYHLSLHISYPNEKDRMRARELGVSPGGNIMIHGIKNGFSWVGVCHSEIDWTKGCIAVTDEDIEEIDRLVPNGTVVEIRP